VNFNRGRGTRPVVSNAAVSARLELPIEITEAIRRIKSLTGKLFN
jgi:hypothetical protein